MSFFSDNLTGVFEENFPLGKLKQFEKRKVQIIPPPYLPPRLDRKVLSGYDLKRMIVATILTAIKLRMKNVVKKVTSKLILFS